MLPKGHALLMPGARSDPPAAAEAADTVDLAAACADVGCGPIPDGCLVMNLKGCDRQQPGRDAVSPWPYRSVCQTDKMKGGC
jgi:hypothetical protein